MKMHFESFSAEYAGS